MARGDQDVDVFCSFFCRSKHGSLPEVILWIVCYVNELCPVLYPKLALRCYAKALFHLLCSVKGNLKEHPAWSTNDSSVCRHL
jgi:hypothetical protein